MSGNKVHFRVSGKITKLLGRESVSEAIIALFELLKNSHDADALGVKVSFENVLSGTGKITISEEKGDGMDIDDIINKFFVIGTYSKEPDEGKTARITRRLKRKMLGSKGVGRFALERLGREVKVIAKPINSLDKFTFVINWDKFEPKNITVDQVGIDIIQEKREERSDSGLEIEITRLRDEWSDTVLNNLQSKLQRLILPKELQPENAFQIILDAPEFGINNKLMDVPLAKKAYYSLSAELFPDRIHVFGKIKGQTSLRENIKFFKPYQAGEKLTEKKISSIRNVSDLTCGPAKLIVYYFPIFQRGIERSEAMNYYGEAFANIIDTNLETFSGVRIFRDGLRAFRYGDPDRDWVERASISRNYSGALQAGRLIGYCLISNEHNSQIRETTNREAAIEDQAFLDLREFVIQSMLKFDLLLNKMRRELSEERRGIKGKKETLNKISSLRKQIKSPTSRFAKAIKKVQEVTGENFNDDFVYLQHIMKEAETIIENDIKSQEEEMTENQIQLCLASLGDTVSWAYHESNRAIDIVQDCIEKLRKHFEGERTRTKDELEKIIQRLIRNWKFSVAWNHYVDSFTSGLTLEQKTSLTKSIIKPAKKIDDLFEDLKVLGKVENIVFENNIPKDLEIITFGAFIESIFSNLLINSIKAFQAQKRNESVENKITIDYEKDDVNITIYFSDNAQNGIPKDQWELVFEPRVSTTARDVIFGGHGLGLSIVRSIIREQNGSIKIVEPHHASGTTLVLQFPTSLLKNE